MQFEPYQIWRAKVSLGMSNDLRPSVIITPISNSELRLMLLSSAMELYRPDIHFLISDSIPEFAATGLKRRSYIIGEKVVLARPEHMQKHLGLLTGQLVADFKKWIGE
jgi:hypothetical protein